jgi:hypothetical protein
MTGHLELSGLKLDPTTAKVNASGVTPESESQGNRMKATKRKQLERLALSKL